MPPILAAPLQKKVHIILKKKKKEKKKKKKRRERSKGMQQPKLNMYGQPVPLPPPFYKQLALAGLAGVVGCVSCYPLDFAKTQLQNQRRAAAAGGGAAGEAAYKGMLDVLVKVKRANGMRGWYRGLLANVTMITPEKGLKIAVNSRARYWLDCDVSFSWVREMLAGGIAGAVQFICTNPMEIVKIRMQTLGKDAGRVSTMDVVRELGLRGLYQNSAATLMRDIPFSMGYFSCYSFLKIQWADEKTHKAALPVVFVAGTISGVLWSGLVTPADVVKTRLQVKRLVEAGSAPLPTRILPMALHILRTDGPLAFFRGVGPRVLSVPPLFGISLTVFELLSDKF
jgi:solute carrier family 25 aspartate/glutamate transporter 12/13